MHSNHSIDRSESIEQSISPSINQSIVRTKYNMSFKLSPSTVRPVIGFRFGAFHTIGTVDFLILLPDGRRGVGRFQREVPIAFGDEGRGRQHRQVLMRVLISSSAGGGAAIAHFAEVERWGGVGAYVGEIGADADAVGGQLSGGGDRVVKQVAFPFRGHERHRTSWMGEKSRTTVKFQRINGWIKDLKLNNNPK